MTRGDFGKGSTTFPSMTRRAERLWAWLIRILKAVYVDVVPQAAEKELSVACGNVGLNLGGIRPPLWLGDPRV